MIHLTENLIRERADGPSFEKGKAYFRSGAIYNATINPTPTGMILMANCEGSSAPFYKLSAVVDDTGIQSTSCSCPYNWGGDCKHLVALLLTYIHQPDKFIVRKDVSELLSNLDKDALILLIAQLVERHPELYDELEMKAPLVKITTLPQQKDPQHSENNKAGQASDQVYRRQVKRIMEQSKFEDVYDEYDEYEGNLAYLDELEDVLQIALQFLQVGDSEDALIILRVLLEETVEGYDPDQDYDGDLAGFIESLGMPMAEAILGFELSSSMYEDLDNSLDHVFEILDEGIEQDELAVVSAALRYGWQDIPEDDLAPDGDDDWLAGGELQEAQLNVLERQQRTNDFLPLAKKINPYRYVLKLIDLNRLDDAISASRGIENQQEILLLAQRLEKAGRLDDAINLAERSLTQQGHSNLEMAAWLAPLEEAQGRFDRAILAYRTAFDANPSMEGYHKLKRLAGEDWDKLRPELIHKVDEHHWSDILVEIYLEEHNWDAAITIAESHTGYYSPLVEKVAEAVIQQRPDWVIQIALAQAEALIEPIQSSLYPSAAGWLSLAKKAYLAMGQGLVWNSYISNLRNTYARRPALQKAIARL